jgi:hypothetical protein
VLIVFGWGTLIYTSFQYYEHFLQIRVGADQMPVSWALQQIQRTSDVSRVQANLTALQTFVQYPLTGIGYNLISGKYINYVIWTENQYLKILAETGLLGFIPFILLFGLIIASSLNLWRRGLHTSDTPFEIQLLMLASLACVWGYMVGHFFADFLHILSTTGYCWVFAGAIFVLDRQHNVVSSRYDEDCP